MAVTDNLSAGVHARARSSAACIKFDDPIPNMAVTDNLSAGVHAITDNLSFFVSGGDELAPHVDAKPNSNSSGQQLVAHTNVTIVLEDANNNSSGQQAMDKLRTDNGNAGKVIMNITAITMGAGAVNATGAGAVNTAGAGAVIITAVLAAQDDSLRSAADTFSGRASGQHFCSTCKKMCVFTGFVVGVAAGYSLKRKGRNSFLRKSVRSLVDAIVFVHAWYD